MKIKADMNENAIRKVVDEYSDTVYKVAFTYCKSHTDAEDICQEVFVRYFQNRGAFKSDIHEKAWLIRVTINCSKSFLRSSWHKRVIPLNDNQEELVFMEGNNDLLNAVLELPVKYREVIHLYYYEGYSTKEISSILTRRETTVRTQLQRGRDILKEKLKEEFIYE